MRKTRIWITLCCCVFAFATLASAQVNRKPGLWEMTTTMKFQQSPLPPECRRLPDRRSAALPEPHKCV